MFQNAKPLKIDLTSNEETASLKDILSKERSNTILETCNHLYISRSVLKTLFDRSNGAIAYIYSVDMIIVQKTILLLSLVTTHLS